MRRLRAQGSVTDGTILRVLSQWTGYESSVAIKQGTLGGANPTKSTESIFPDSVRLLSALETFTYGRPDLEAKLLERRAYLYQTCNDYARTVSAYEKAVGILTPLGLSIHTRRIDDLVQTAGTLYVMGQKLGAEADCLEVMSYAWHMVKDPDAFHKLHDLYVQAGRLLIEIRRHDLQALKDTYFMQSTQDELSPPLRAAIQEAETERRP